MSWLAKLDARAAHWTPVNRFVYTAAKWSLVALGAFALLGVWADRIGVWDMYAH